MLSFSLDLWEGFEYRGSDEPYRPSLDGYVIKSDAARPAVLILPGSGYFRCSPREAEPLALRFNAAGWHSFVLWYSCAPRRHPLPILDCARAISLIRENAAGWNLDPCLLAMLGFSAGGHAALSETIFRDRDFASAPGINPGTARADFLLLGYPVISSGPFAHRGSFENLLGENPDAALLELLSLEKQAEKCPPGDIPPVFLWHTWADADVPVENSLLLADSLRKAEVPLEMHLFPKGKHGLSLAIPETAVGDPRNIEPAAAQWFGLCLNWLKDQFDRLI